MVKHNKNFKSKKKQSLKKKALRKTKRKGGKKSKKNIGGEMFWDECYKRKARFNVTVNDYKNKEYDQTTNAIHGYAFSGNFKKKLHEFYYEKWDKAVKGDSQARIYFGKPRTASSFPTIQFALDRALRCPNSTLGEETNTRHIQNLTNPNQEGRTKKGDTKYLKFFIFNNDDQYEFPIPDNPTHDNREQPPPQKKPRPILQQASEDNFLENLKKYGFNQIKDRKKDSIEEKYCTIRLPSYIGTNSKSFRTDIISDLQKSDKNFLNNTWYVFYKHHSWDNHSWDNSIFGKKHNYFQYGDPDKKITGKEFIDLLDNQWTQAINVDSTTLELQGATTPEEKQRAKERAYEINHNANINVEEQNLVVKDFYLVREFYVDIFGKINDSCKQ